MPEISGIYYPPVKFMFGVNFTGAGISGEASFMEVSGIQNELGEETIAEGGVLNLVHKVPLGVTVSDLTLKRGLLTSSSVRTWMQNAIQNFQFTPIQVQVNLLNGGTTTLMSWTFQNVWPKKWEVDSLNSMENAIVIESMVLAYSYMTVG